MARAADTAATDASNQYSNYATSALNNYNSQATAASDDISNLEGQGNPYQSKSYLQNQNIQTSAAMDATNTAAKQQLNDDALRTGTNTASLGRTISSNARAGQRTMDAYNAGQSAQNEDKYLSLQQGLIGDRQNLANSEAGVLGTTSGAQTNADGQLVTLQGQNDQMWGNVIGGAAGAVGSVFAGKG
jgi:hypothetical protein